MGLPAHPGFRAVSRGERGFTLPELTMAITLALVTAAAAMAIVSMAVRTQPRVTERAGQIQQGRTMVERIVRELRQGESVSSATTSGLEILTYVDSASCGGAVAATAIVCRVAYSCTTTSCSRTERNPDGSGSAPAERVVDGILGPGVFSYSPSATDPSYVGVTLAYPAEDGGEGVTVSDGVALRNHLEGAPGA